MSPLASRGTLLMGRGVPHTAQQPASKDAPPPQPTTTTALTNLLTAPATPKVSLPLPPRHLNTVVTLWVHEPNFAKEDILVNLDCFPPGTVQVGDLLRIEPTKRSQHVTWKKPIPGVVAPPKSSLKPGGIMARKPLSLGYTPSGTEKDKKGKTVSWKKKKKKKEDDEEEEEKAVDDPKRSAMLENCLVFFVKDLAPEHQSRHQSLEISLASHLASTFNLKHRECVRVTLTDVSEHMATHVELTFRDQHLGRSDMWRLALNELSEQAIYKGQRIQYLGTMVGWVKNVYVGGKKTPSAFIPNDVRAIYRSESARFVIFIQMSREMWDFGVDESGDINFEKVVHGFLPELFKRWCNKNVRHLVTIVFFTRMEYDEGDETLEETDLESVNQWTRASTDARKKVFRDYYRVVVSEMGSSQWIEILNRLKVAFADFRKDVSIRSTKKDNGPMRLDDYGEPWPRPEFIVAGNPSAALDGNILEAVNLACSQFYHDNVDCDLGRTGVSVVVVTPSPGIFEVDYHLLKTTTETLISNGIAIDLVCLCSRPTYTTPLFMYPDPSKPVEEGKPSWSTAGLLAAVPHWLDVSYWTGKDSDKSSRPFEDAKGTLHGASSRGGEWTDSADPDDPSNFTPSMKMYQIQMMGLPSEMENRIVIPPLSDSPFYPKLPNLPYPDPPTRLASERSVPFGPALPPKMQKERDRQLAIEDRAQFDWMDTYDSMAFLPIKKVREAQAELEKKWAEGEARKLAARLREKFGESFDSPDDNTTSHLASHRSRGTSDAGSTQTSSDQPKSSRNVSITSRDEPVLKPWKVSNASIYPLRTTTGLGTRGFQPAAPKATTSTERTSQHAMAMSGTFATALAPTTTTDDSGPSGTGTPIKKAAGVAGPFSSLGRRSVRGEDLSKHNSGPNQMVSSRPIAIKSAMRFAESRLHPSRSRVMSSENISKLRDAFIAPLPEVKVPASVQRGMLEDTSTTSKMVPWLTLVNHLRPSDPVILDGPFRPWQHINPSPNLVNDINWKSLCAPASVPLTTSYFPTAEQLRNEYQETPYSITLPDHQEVHGLPKTREELLRAMMGVRLGYGFQIVIGPSVSKATGHAPEKIANVFNSSWVVRDGDMVFMLMGSSIHQLLCTEDTDIEVKKFIRKPTRDLVPPRSKHAREFQSVYPPANNAALSYEAYIKPLFGPSYECRKIQFQRPRPEYNWNYVDSYLAGYVESNTVDNSRSWLARFVLIPMHASSSHSRRTSRPLNEDNEEETRLEGIRKLTHLWQRHRYVPAQKDQPMEPPELLNLRVKADLNPLDIVYQTRDPSVVVNAELDTFMPLDMEPSSTIRRSRMFSDLEPFQMSKINLSALAKEIQGEDGVRMQDRRWHWRLHYNCFIGFELTTWILNNFRDVDTRDEAVVVGNQLMKKGLFHHVERRHQFRDGNFFYQLEPEFGATRPESKGGWFGSRKSAATDGSASPVVHGSSKSDEIRGVSPTSGPSAPSPAHPSKSSGGSGNKRLKVMLSKVMLFNVDLRKRSYRQELINLHYDRLHNPDNCYHIRLDWMNATAKFIEDAIVIWTTQAARYGLRLVEVPIAEASKISENHPFRTPLAITLALPPPTEMPPAIPSFSPKSPQLTSPHIYHRSILHHHSFVLDVEAATNFSPHIDVSYSWGKPNYQYSQFIHRSGLMLAQITHDGTFLLLPNRLVNNRAAAQKERVRFEKRSEDWGGNSEGPRIARPPTPPRGGGPALADDEAEADPLSVEAIKEAFEKFCADAKGLEVFYASLERDGESSVLMSPLESGMTVKVEQEKEEPEFLKRVAPGANGTLNSQASEFTSTPLSRSSLVSSPLTQIHAWFTSALATLPIPETATLSTASASGCRRRRVRCILILAPAGAGLGCGRAGRAVVGGGGVVRKVARVEKLLEGHDRIPVPPFWSGVRDT
ncbi:MAG: vacuolar membrane-associated protein iml1 [Trizodia sp. TS-e1964]|nr:MAG: vacuolar membrane-associated protein iml1 [Trizodia sp. TS-e1964]